jgi:hypothetical protein
MNFKMNMGRLFLGLLFMVEFSVAAPVVREASFYQIMDGKDYYGTGYYDDMSFKLSTMSADGKVVAFYSTDGAGNNHKLFIHDFESTADPVEVIFPTYVGNFNQNAGLVSNTDGTRIFFNARDTEGDYHHHLFGMVNGKTGAVTILLRTSTVSPSYVDEPQDIGTDAAGNYLYFNESNNGYGQGNLYRINAQSGAVRSEVIHAASVPHPSGGTVKFIDQFDVSDDGQTIAFFGLGRDNTDGTTGGEEELFVKTSEIKNLTNTQNLKDDLVISGDASTIVYVENYDWMVTSPDAVVDSQRNIEVGYQSCGNRPGITQDGTFILGTSTPDGTSSCNTYLIRTDGSSRLMIEPSQINILTTYDGLHLSNDGTRTFFKNRWYVYPTEWYTMTVGVFGPNLWSTEVPAVTDVSYPNDMYTKLDNNKQFDIRIAVSDPQGIIIDDNRVKEYTLFPNGYKAYSGGTITVYMDSASVSTNLYSARGARGSLYPSRVPIMTARFSVLDDDFNVGYIDTLIQSLIPIAPVNYLLLD